MEGIADRARRAAPAPVKRVLRTPWTWVRAAQQRRLLSRVSNQYPLLPGIISGYHAGTSDPEVVEVLGFLRTSDAQMLPYRWVEEYRPEDIDVCRDASGMVRATVEAASVYFPAALSEQNVAEAVAGALAEQDPRSPHAYWCGALDLRPDDVAVLVGASDGIYALHLVDRVARLYLFEADGAWTDALERTLEPWRHKVVIIPKYVGDQDGESTVTLDAFFAAEGVQPNYLQADVEGGELALLNGAQGILAAADRIAVSICCYHHQEDQATLECILHETGLRTHTTPGYMVLWPQLLSPPYLRRGVIHAMKWRNLRERTEHEARDALRTEHCPQTGTPSMVPRS